MEKIKGEKKNWNNKCDFFANWGLLLYFLPSGNVTLKRGVFSKKKKLFLVTSKMFNKLFKCD